MSSEQDRARELAGRVARRLAEASGPEGAAAPGEGGDFASLRSALGEIQRRLAHIESHLDHGPDCGQGREAEGRAGDAAPRHPSSEGSGRSTGQARRTGPAAEDPAPPRSMWLSGTYVPAVSHPSQERFNNVGEAVSELVEFFESEKTCTVEPGGKPCDHCGMCSARGF